MKIMSEEKYNIIIDVIISLKDQIKKKDEEIRRMKNQISFYEKLLEKKVDVEVHEIHTFAKPEDVSDIDFPNKPFLSELDPDIFREGDNL